MIKLNKTAQLYELSVNYLVGGVNSPVRSFSSVDRTPVFIDHAQGKYITDVDGNQYYDFVLAYGPAILGHAHPEVTQALTQSLSKGYTYGANSANEIELAQLILSAYPEHQKIRFVNSGTEAVFSAIRLARGYTQKHKIIKFSGCYHGHADSLLVQSGSGLITHSLPSSQGVPPGAIEDTLIANYNNLAQVEQFFTQYPQQIAAVIIEPIAGNMGVVIPQQGFLQQLKELCQQYNALLIIDEIMTGYRSTYGSIGKVFNIEADITCLGKVIGGGLPIGAYLAKAEIMDLLSPLGGVYQAGTFSGNPLSMIAGIITLQQLQQLNPYAKFTQLTEQLATIFTTSAKKYHLDVTVNRFGSMISPFFTKHQVIDFDSAKTSDTQLYSKFFTLMLEEGYFLPPSQFESWFLSTETNEQDIAQLAQVIDKIFAQLSS